VTPFRLNPAGKDYLWGGERLKTLYGKVSALSPLAESWECSVHPDGPSTVATGSFSGKALPELLAEHPEFLGHSPSARGGLHVLVKLIDAKGDLSVQVHPDDDYAFREEGGQQGKTEMWYVLDAEPGACLVFGLDRAATADEVRAGLAAGTFESMVRRVPVQCGDVFYIPSGTIHAIGGGILLAEVQQNSNLTYRLYDYGRLGKDGRPRDLHIDKALAVADLSGAQSVRQPMRTLRYRPGFGEELLCECPYFQVSRCLLNSDALGEPDASSPAAGAGTGPSIVLPPLPESYRVLLCTDGAGALSEKAGAGSATEPGELRFRKGDTVFIPATCGALTLSGRAEFLLIRG